MTSYTAESQQPATPPANVKLAVGIIVGLLVLGLLVAILAIKSAGLADKPGFTGLGGTMLADITLVLHVLLLIGLTAGYWLARKGNISAHQYNQTAWVLFNLVLVEFVMVGSFQANIRPGLPADLPKHPYYWLTTLHALLGGITMLIGVYILLRMNKLLPKALRVSWWKTLMRVALAGYWLVTILGFITYYIWYMAPF